MEQCRNIWINLLDLAKCYVECLFLWLLRRPEALPSCVNVATGLVISGLSHKGNIYVHSTQPAQ